MSYSFDVRGASVAQAREAAAAKLADVAAQQPIHGHDHAAALATVNAFLELVDEPVGGSDLQVSVHGSISKIEGMIGSVSIGVNVCFVPQTAG